MAEVPSLDDVVCPACITAMVVTGDAAECPTCDYWIPEDAVPMRVMLQHPGMGGATWANVHLPALVCWLRDALASDSGSSAGGEQ